MVAWGFSGSSFVHDGAMFSWGMLSMREHRVVINPKRSGVTRNRLDSAPDDDSDVSTDWAVREWVWASVFCANDCLPSIEFEVVEWQGSTRGVCVSCAVDETGDAKLDWLAR